MFFINVIVGVLTGVGLYQILADLVRLPHTKASKAVNNLAKKQNERVSTIDIWLGSVSATIAKHLHLNEYKQQDLSADLRTAQIDMTPEQYTANAIVRALLIALLAVPAYFVFPLMSPMILLLAFLTYRINIRKVTGAIKIKRGRIENDLPKLVAVIEQKIQYQRSIVDILEDFQKHAGDELKQELAITIADMRSGNEEEAITRLDGRVGSPMMSDVCRGFVTLIHGDVATVYWSSLKLKFDDIQRQRLRAEADKIPKKVRRLSLIMLVCFMLMYMVIIVVQITGNLGILFG